MGDNLFQTTNTPGYKHAVEYFESEINQQLRSTTPDVSYIRGIQAVFDYFDSGIMVSNKAHEEIKKYGNEPE